MVDVGWGREWADKEVDKAKGLAKRYQQLTDRYTAQAGDAVVVGDYAKANTLNARAREARDCLHYWLGHMNAFQGLATQLGFMEIVEDELEEEGSCP